MKLRFGFHARIAAGCLFLIAIAGPGSVKGADCFGQCDDEASSNAPSKPFGGILPREVSEFERLAGDSEVLAKIGSRKETVLNPDLLRVLVWNIHKGGDFGFAGDFARLGSRADLLLLQEAIRDSRDSSSFLGRTPEHEWHMASSFFFGGGTATGVATGAQARPFSVSFIRSPVRELFVTTPKMTLVTEYRLKGMMRRLLVINVHAINFVDRYSFLANMAQIDRALSRHDGPVLLAGDFNTWSSTRLTFLHLMALRNGLKNVSLKRDHRFLKLDHVLVREIKIHNAELLDVIQSSDHKPISLELSVTRRPADPMPAH